MPTVGKPMVGRILKGEFYYGKRRRDSKGIMLKKVKANVRAAVMITAGRRTAKGA